jgi:SAM-dependent methyltransferase
MFVGDSAHWPLSRAVAETIMASIANMVTRSCIGGLDCQATEGARMSVKPQLLVDLTRPARRLIATSIYSAPAVGFDHAAAQRYELLHAKRTIEADFPGLLAEVDVASKNGDLWMSSADHFFSGDQKLFDAVIERIGDRRCLEVGCGPFGYLAPCRWLKTRVFIDPLIDEYRLAQLPLTGRTLFTADVETHSSSAETPIPTLFDAVDGLIVCRNAIDHCEDPLSVLANISAYAAPGCYFLFWADIWHLDGPDAGHRNITKSTSFMDAAMDGLGFRILRRSDQVRGSGECVEYGCVAVKKAA